MPSLAPSSGQDWTVFELAEIRRLERVCQSVAHWELARDHTDAGDPWCVIYDTLLGGVVLHIARIDRRYIVVAPIKERCRWTASMQSAIELAMQEIAAA